VADEQKKKREGDPKPRFVELRGGELLMLVEHAA
jgi:hypothetical protein